MRKIDALEQKRDLKQRFAAAKVGGTVLTARQLAPARLFAEIDRKFNVWSVSGDDQPIPSGKRVEYRSAEWFLANYLVPETVLKQGFGLVRYRGCPVESLRLTDSLILWTNVGMEIGEAGDYLTYDRVGDHLRIVSPDLWVEDFCPE